MNTRLRTLIFAALAIVLGACSPSEPSAQERALGNELAEAFFAAVEQVGTCQSFDECGNGDTPVRWPMTAEAKDDVISALGATTVGWYPQHADIPRTEEITLDNTQIVATAHGHAVTMTFLIERYDSTGGRWVETYRYVANLNEANTIVSVFQLPNDVGREEL